MLVNKATALETSAHMDEIWEGLQHALQAEGIDFLIYLTVDARFENPLLRTNIPQIYADMPPERDPFLSHCCHSYDITLTGISYLPDYDYLPDSAKAFIARARKTGFQSGMGIPMRLQSSQRFGGFNLGTRLEQSEFEATIVPRAEEFRLFCLLMHRRLEELAHANPNAVPDDFRTLLIAPEESGLASLSPREREVAYLIARGVSRKECARLCTISPHTVSEYLKSVYRKLNINNRVALTQMVLQQPAAPVPMG